MDKIRSAPRDQLCLWAPLGSAPTPDPLALRAGHGPPLANPGSASGRFVSESAKLPGNFSSVIEVKPWPYGQMFGLVLDALRFQSS